MGLCPKSIFVQLTSIRKGTMFDFNMRSHKKSAKVDIFTHKKERKPSERAGTPHRVLFTLQLKA